MSREPLYGGTPYTNYYANLANRWVNNKVRHLLPPQTPAPGGAQAGAATGNRPTEEETVCNVAAAGTHYTLLGCV